MKIDFDNKDDVIGLKKYILENNKGIPAHEANSYFEIIKRTGLNPYNKEIILQAYGSRYNAIITRDGYRQASQQHPQYDSHYVASVYANDDFFVENGKVNHRYQFDNRGELLGAYCIARRKNSKHDFLSMVYMSEYNTKANLWASKKDTMIKKVAEAQGLRQAFQDMFVATYDEAELFKDESEDIVIDDKKISIDLIEEKKQEESKEDMIRSIGEKIKEVSVLDKEFDLQKVLDYFSCEIISDLQVMDLERLNTMLESKIKKIKNMEV